MEEEIMYQLPQRPVSMADMLKGREIKKQNIRKEFAEEAYEKMSKKWDKRTIA